jgi:hypothetical protein
VESAPAEKSPTRSLARPDATRVQQAERFASAGPILQLQSTAGNAAVARLLVQRQAAGENSASPTGAGPAIARVQALIPELERVHALASRAAGPAGHPHVDSLAQHLELVRAAATSGDEQLCAGVLAALAPARLQEHEQTVLQAAEPSGAVELSLPQGTGAASVQRQMSQVAGPPIQRQVADALKLAGVGILEADVELAPIEATNPIGWGTALGLAVVGGLLLGAGVLMSSGGRPKSNTDQNKQFNDAIREIERRLGRRLTADERRRLHEALHEEEDPGFWEIVNLGMELFGSEVAPESEPPSSGGGGSPDNDAGPVGADDEE